MKQNPDKQLIAELRQQLAALETRAGLEDQIRHLSTRIDLPGKKPLLRHSPRHTRPAVAVLHCSDWHVGETVDPAKVNGLNEYSPAIAEKRMERLFAGARFLVEQKRRTFDIRRMLVTLNGDMISGYIHPELVEANSMSPVKEVLFAAKHIIRGLRNLLEIDGLQIHVVCQFGNHGRTTEKTRIATAADNSYETLLYHFVAAHFKSEKRITWQLPTGHHAVVEVAGMRVHVHHGDSVKYGGGVGGILVPLTRAALRWRAMFKAQLSLVGHFHQYHPGQVLVVNGSLVGHGTYSDFLGIEPEPAQQAFFLIDAQRGVTEHCPIWVQEAA